MPLRASPDDSHVMASDTRRTRVIAVGGDARVRAALAALIDATLGLRSIDVATAATDGAFMAAAADADVAVVDIDEADPERDLRALSELATHLPVIAVSASSSHALRAFEAGAAAFCDKDGDTDALTAAVRAAATDPDRSSRRTG